MNLIETIDSITKQFTTRYAKKFADLNKNVYPTAKNDKGSFEVPVPVLSKGGGTLNTGDAVFPLDYPASVSVVMKNMKPETLIYRINFPFRECQIAAEKPEYFNYLFDAIISKALGNYQLTVGGPDKVRFGEAYCSYEPLKDKTLFTSDGGDLLELRLHGCWASNVEDYA